MTKPSGPYRDASTNAMYALLFCDDLDIYRHTVKKPWTNPWDVLLVEDPDLKGLQKIAEDHSLESRIRLLALHALRLQGIAPKQKELLAVIVELGLEEGPDTLASFSEGTARYLNYSGKILVWENADEKSRAITDKLFVASEKIVQQIGPWT
ncbi:MAG TPA: hypothetical protein VJ508_06065, partial [Saprospiraceae bacterium]|nr:hypothetical protein [Saprospiraceae bacterium]